MALAIILAIVLGAILWESYQESKRQEALDRQSTCVARAVAQAAINAGETTGGPAAQRVMMAYLNGSICQ